MDQAVVTSHDVGVVGGDKAGQERVIDALNGEDIAVETAADVDDVLDENGAVVDCVVVLDPAEYDRVRAADATAPVVVVSATVDRERLEGIVGDDAAAHLQPGAGLATALPVRIDRLVGGDEAGWQVAEFTDEAVVAFDLETYGLLAANDRFYEAWGWDSERLRSSTLADLRETDITHELRGKRTGRESEEGLEWFRDEDPVDSLVERASGGLYEVREWHCRRETGRPFKTEVRAVVDEQNGRGYLVASLPAQEGDDQRGYIADAVGSDTDDALPDEASMLRSLIEHVPMSVYFKDRKSRHVLASEDLVEPFVESPEGKIMHTPEDVIGKTDFDLYPPAGAAGGVQEDRDVMATGRPLVDKLERVQPPSGRPLFFQTTKAPWYDDEGRVHGVVGVTVDVTEQKRRELELDRQNERLAEFASIVSHDLRNPLNVAKGRLQMYRETGDESELEAVVEMHDRMAGLIDDALAFAREGNRVEDPEWLAGDEYARKAWEAVETGEATLDQDWAYAIQADARRLVRLFENLFRNAVEHAGPDVAVEVGTLADEPGFYVQDDGSGIPQADRETVFERGVTTSEEGTGFGLAIVREIADAHGWDVAATESPDGGARFEFAGVPRGDGED